MASNDCLVEFSANGLAKSVFVHDDEVAAKSVFDLIRFYPTRLQVSDFWPEQAAEV
jgi:hypothetical protein